MSIEMPKGSRPFNIETDFGKERIVVSPIQLRSYHPRGESIIILNIGDVISTHLCDNAKTYLNINGAEHKMITSAVEQILIDGTEE